MLKKNNRYLLLLALFSAASGSFIFGESVWLSKSSVLIKIFVPIVLLCFATGFYRLSLRLGFLIGDKHFITWTAAFSGLGVMWSSVSLPLEWIFVPRIIFIVLLPASIHNLSSGTKYRGSIPITSYSVSVLFAGLGASIGLLLKYPYLFSSLLFFFSILLSVRLPDSPQKNSYVKLVEKRVFVFPVAISVFSFSFLVGFISPKDLIIAGVFSGILASISIFLIARLLDNNQNVSSLIVLICSVGLLISFIPSLWALGFALVCCGALASIFFSELSSLFWLSLSAITGFLTGSFIPLSGLILSVLFVAYSINKWPEDFKFPMKKAR